jgi:nucleotide-binding universal stress UspA family protein
MLERVVLAYDFSERCDDALAWTVDLVRALRGRVHLVHVVSGRGEDDPTLNDLRRELASVADEAGAEVLSHVLVGDDVAKTLVAHAEDVNADALVIATRATRGVARWLLGSVADEVVAAAHCPVITLRAQDD